MISSTYEFDNNMITVIYRPKQWAPHASHWRTAISDAEAGRGRSLKLETCRLESKSGSCME